MVNLREAVERYTELAGSFGTPVALSAFGLNTEETENLFTVFDEDYHISRFLHFSHADGQTYSISGDTVTHIAVDPAIHSIL